MNTITLLFVLLVILISFNDAFLHNRIKKSFSKNNILNVVISCEEGQFESEVLKSSVPVIVDFYANWCGPCKAVAPVFNMISDEYPANEIKFVKVDTDVHESTVDAYNIQGLPLFAIFNNGKVIATHSGAMSKDPLRKFVEKALPPK